MQLNNLFYIPVDNYIFLSLLVSSDSSCPHYACTTIIFMPFSSVYVLQLCYNYYYNSSKYFLMFLYGYSRMLDKLSLMSKCRNENEPATPLSCL